MSGVNGDKSRFHRERKQKLARRKRNQALFEKLKEQSTVEVSAPGSKPKAVKS